jgi:phosphoribosylamine--glycine ligase
VLKADGLAAGKGVVIPKPARKHWRRWRICSAVAYAAGAEVVIEEFMLGEEASFALTDGATILSFGCAQDHKRVGEGGYPIPAAWEHTAPRPKLDRDDARRGVGEDHGPTVRTLATEGMLYSGRAVCRATLTDQGPKLIYTRCFGDP